ncbi:MAG: DDE-type integrase/transposase/recombinase, partial [Syntrophales bacterium]|nr:DDE-type integrase/transposase/recombinase [Syntrophales bacterium]
SVISDFANGSVLVQSQHNRLMKDKYTRKWQIPFSEKTRISKGAIFRWIRLYTNSNGDLTSLYPKDRSDQGKSRALDEETCLSLIDLRLQMLESPISKLIEQMYVQKRLTPGTVLSNSTVYRFLHQENLMHQLATKPEDRRKFEAELPNDLWQSDVMHGPSVNVEGRMRKTYLIAIIDDHSRLIVYAKFYLSENLESYLSAFENALARRGLPRKLYVDNGAAFRSRQLEYISALLSIALIHARPYKPQGKGKIERWFKTVRARFLLNYTAVSLDELNADLTRWINDDYHQKKHTSTGQTPFERFTSQMHCLRRAPANLKDYFRQVARRTISKDRTITLNGRLYEGPVALIGKRVELLYHETEPKKVEVKYQNKSFGFIRPVDIHVNCRVKRDKNNNPQSTQDHHGAYRGGALFNRRDSHEE